MSISEVNGYKIVEEEASAPLDVSVRFGTLLFDFSHDAELTKTLLASLQTNLFEVNMTNVSFISVYKHHISPVTFVGLAVAKWLTPDDDESGLSDSDYCYPVFVAVNNLYQEDNINEMIMNYLMLKATSQKFAQELTKEIFDE